MPVGAGREMRSTSGMPRARAVLAGLLLSIAPAHAFGPRDATQRAARVTADELTAMPAAGASKPLRAHRGVSVAPRATAAWQRFVGATGSWQATWDPATGVPSRIWGAGIAAPGAMASPAIAERIARAVLADHLALLAPGARLADFVLVANHSDGDLRSVGFVQHAGGRRVVGGQVSFRFKRDRLFVIGSEALPDVRVAVPRTRLARAALHARATDELRRELALPAAPVTAPGDEVVLPLVGDAAVLGYRLAAPLTIDGGAEGRYLAYVDPASGAVLAVHQQHRYATGTVQYRSVDRYPGRGRRDLPAPRANVTVDGVAQTTTPAGAVTWSPDAPATLVTGVVGPLVEVVNTGATGTLAATQLTLEPGGQVVWDASTNSEDDAQVVTFLAANAVKEYVRATIDPAMKGLDASLQANTNIPKSCNAFFDGMTINFFAASMACQNTGLLEDVIYHEFGHALHQAEIIEGVGAHDGAFGEGAADFLAASITGDPGMGRGLFYNDDPLRHLDPAGDEFRWPDDLGEIHGTGRIIGGAFWDLRTALIAELGEPAGVALVNRLYLAALRRAVSIPTSFVEVLAADDDDGDLANGTPHECAILGAFGRHGLRMASGRVDAPATLVTTAPSTEVRIELTGLSSRCAADAVERVLLIWIPGVKATPVAGSAHMTATGPSTYAATVPLPQDDVLYYSARVQFADGSTLTLADNLADRFYTLYQGETVPLYCTSFDDDPFAAGWTTGTVDGRPSPWAWGPPAGGITDPPAAFTGTSVLAQNLGGDYERDLASYVRLPPIDIGTWSDVHLQYRRWLAVEDSQFDKARVTVDGAQAWLNGTGNRGDSSAFHHVDKEWRFHDVRVSGYTFGTTIDVGFELAADPGLQLGGWAIDDLCVVANVHSICGDGVVSGSEQCDQGDRNENIAGACRTYCMKPACGDGIRDGQEECDDGTAGSEECTSSCERIASAGGGCCSTSRGGATGSLVLGTFVVFGWLALGRRRRRRL